MSDPQAGQVWEIPYRYKVVRVEGEFAYLEGTGSRNEVRVRLDDMNQYRLVSDPQTGWDESRVPGKRWI
jgi:hypothetical protein